MRFSSAFRTSAALLRCGRNVYIAVMALLEEVRFSYVVCDTDGIRTCVHELCLCRLSRSDTAMLVQVWLHADNCLL
jgi:hypothetical protein